MRIFVLLDRSGSMTPRWNEVLTMIEGWTKDAGDNKVTFAVFDHEYASVIERGAPGEIIPAIKTKEIGPRGTTALFDAIGRMGDTINTLGKKKGQVVIITDGQENSSRQHNKATAGRIVAGWKERGYDVVFLGADFDAFSEAQQIGIAQGQTMSFNSQSAEATASVLRARTMSYADTGVVSDFSDEDRAKVQPRALPDEPPADTPPAPRKSRSKAPAPDQAPDTPPDPTPTPAPADSPADSGPSDSGSSASE
jgi:hypothetical protein